MTEEAKEQDVNIQEPVAPVEEATVETQQEQSKPEVGTKEYNWRKMESKMQELERRNQELASNLQSMKQPEKQELNELEQLQEDDLITVGQMKKLAELRAKQVIEQELAKREQAALPAKTKGQYTDYDQVVTAENIEKLINEDPDLEHDIKVAKNPYARA
jgi:hypothetical protein